MKRALFSFSADLFSKLSFIGVPPYYVFLCRPTLGNETYSVPVEWGYEIFEKSRTLCSGLAKRARLVMSHESGKIESKLSTKPITDKKKKNDEQTTNV